MAVGVALLLALPYWFWATRDIETSRIKPVKNGQLAARIPDGIVIRDFGLGIHTVSWDRGRIGYIGEQGSQSCLVVNDSVVHCGAGTSSPRLNIDGSVWACKARSADGGGSYVARNGEISETYREIKWLTLSPLRGKVAYAALGADGWHGVCDGRAGPAYDDVESVRINDSRCWYAARKADRWFVVADGVPGPPFDRIERLTVGPAGQRWAYVGREGRALTLVMDGVPAGNFRAVKEIWTDLAGGNFAAAVLDGAGWRIFFNGRLSDPIGKTVIGIDSLFLNQIEFSAEGKGGITESYIGDLDRGFRRSRGSEQVRLATSMLGVGTMDYPRVLEIREQPGGERGLVYQEGRELRWQVRNSPDPTQYEPVDESWIDPELRAVRERVIEALKARSASMLLAHVDAEVRAGFGDECCGHKVFVERWGIEDPKSSFWDTALGVMQGGGVRRVSGGREEFVAPATESYPYDHLGPLFQTAPDPFGGVAVTTRSETELLGEPRPGAAKIASLTPQAVGLVESRPPDWTKVITVTGQQGWLESRALAHSLSPRAFFAKRGGVWKMIAFVKGD